MSIKHPWYSLMILPTFANSLVNCTHRYEYVMLPGKPARHVDVMQLGTKTRWRFFSSRFTSGHLSMHSWLTGPFKEDDLKLFWQKNIRKAIPWWSECMWMRECHVGQTPPEWIAALDYCFYGVYAAWQRQRIKMTGAANLPKLWCFNLSLNVRITINTFVLISMWLFSCKRI